jgi:general stress protein CsbA
MLVATILICVLINSRIKMDASDWGTWVGAIGTVGTLIGTVILATAETRRRHREEMQLARISAAALLPRLIDAESCIKSVVRDLDGEAPSENFREITSAFGERLDELVLWKPDEMRTLIALLENDSAHLAIAAKKIEMQKEKFSRIVFAYHRRPILPSERKDIWNDARNELTYVSGVLTAARIKCMVGIGRH